MKKLLIVVFVIVALGVHAQDTSSTINKKNTALEHFDIKNFTKHQINEEYKFTLPNGDEVQQVGYMRMEYTERVEKQSSHCGEYKEFYRSGELKRSGPTFDGLMIGTHYYYDEKGNLTNAKNFEPEFPFRIGDLVKKMKDEYNLDITNKKLKIMMARLTTPRPLYEITFPSNLDNSGILSHRELSIDGKDGLVISDSILRRHLKYNE